MGKTSGITTGRRCARLLFVQQYINLASEGGLAMNKVIFLDVGGVLNNGTWAIEMFDKGIRIYHDDLSAKRACPSSVKCTFRINRLA